MDDLPGLAEALDGIYELQQELGEGATALVYLARDVKHDREVALKVLRPELSAAVGADRFVREIRIAARLNHPHILPMFDSGEAGGFLYYTMPRVRGESLDERLAREGRLPLSTALAIAGQVSSALHHAHQEGVIHRDIKPGNILLADGHAWVADFGIARAVRQAAGEKLTRTGLVVGTPTYMSPEQAFGQGQIDGRTDTYALGCVLFEMLKGRPPFEARTMAALMAKHATDAVPSLRIDDESIPLFVERAVKQALAKDPADRFSSPRALGETLAEERVVEVVGRRRLAVLPPTNVVGDPEQEFLTLGLQEALISRLSKGDVSVLARSSVAHQAGSSSPLREIARELGVDALVESSLFRSGDRIGIEARLVDGADEEGLWSESFEGEVQDILRLYRDVANATARAVLGATAPRRPKTSELQVVDPAAYENYMRGRVHQQRFLPADLQRGLRYYEMAIEIQPDYAAAHAGMALIWGSMTVLGMMAPSESGPLWVQSARRAVDLGPDLGEAHQAMAQVQTWYQWDFEAAEVAWERAIDLDSHNPEACAFYAHFLAMMGRAAESDAAMARALAVDPFNPFTATLGAAQTMLVGRYAEALALHTQLPPNPLSAEGAAFSAATLGREEEALTHLAAHFDMLALSDCSRAIRSKTSMRDGFAAAAEYLIELSSSTFVRPTGIAVLLAKAWRFDQALDWFERGEEIRDFQTAYLGAVPIPPEIRGHTRFQALLGRVGLPQRVFPVDV